MLFRSFLGNAPWSVPSLRALASSRHRVKVAVTRVPRPAGRGGRLTPTAVAAAARELGLPVVEAAAAREGAGLEAIAAAAPDVLAVVAYGEILPPDVLRIPRIAPVNVHFSLLPALRGAAPVQRAILWGHERTGVTTIEMDAGMDTGPILLQRETSIEPDEDAGALGARLASMGAGLLVETLDALAAGTVDPTPQEDSLATYAPRITSDDERIDWSRPAEEIVRQVRALSPEPGAWTTFRGMRVKVLAARSHGGFGWTSYPPKPGRITIGDDGQLIVHAGDGRAVHLDAVAPAGRRRMTGAEFARGNRPEAFDA